jgi:glycosyltransferase involved in cell wall biosynthesis
MTPLVSILIPAYNAHATLADTITSALAQSWVNKEVIIVDDGSQDQTLAVAQKFAGANVKVVTQSNQGAAATRNRLAALAQGEYLQWLDADDLLSPDKVANQLAVALESGSRRTLISCGWAHFIYRPHSAKFVPTKLWENLSPHEWLLRKWENNLHMQTATWLVSRELTDAAGPWNPQMAVDDDGEYFFRVILASDGIRFVPDEKVYYRISGSNRVSYIGRSDKKMAAQIYGMRLQIRALLARTDDVRTRAACVTYLQTWLPNFYPHRMDLVKQAEQLAAELGGQLATPELAWKYRWIQQTLGWSAAQAAQLHYNGWKAAVLRAWDLARFRLERHPNR